MVEDAPIPRKGFLTLDEEEKLTKLRQDRQDAAREERELLLAARARKPADYRMKKLNDYFEKMVEGLSPREREGAGLLTKEEFIQWNIIHFRAFTAVEAQCKLIKAAWQRIRAEGWGTDG